MLKTVLVKTTTLVQPDNNPRKIKKKDLRRLTKSIQDFPKMLEIRPIVVDENNVILAGNQRFKAALELKMEKVPVLYANNLSEVEKREFIIKDNLHSGEFSMEILADKWDAKELVEFGMTNYKAKTKQEEDSVIFSSEIDEASNYVVLIFNKDIDFTNIQSLLGISSTYSKRANGKPWSKGIGRVVDGVNAIKLIQSAKPTGKPNPKTKSTKS